jgi:hypothetical protein
VHIKKYTNKEHCKEFFDRFESMPEEQQQSYVDNYFIGLGKQDFSEKKSGDYVCKRTVSKVLYVKRGDRGYQRFDSYTNRTQLESIRNKLHSNGYDTYVENGQVRWVKILKSEVNTTQLFIEEISPSYGAMSVTKSKKAMQAKFWNNK